MTAGALAASAVAAAQAPAQPSAQTSIPDRGPRLDLDLVREFVIAGHHDLNRTRELIDQHPTLINAAWDWGGGDWETGLGAAAHMGRRDIALFLLDRGARLDLFAAAMLGYTEVVRAALAERPELVDTRGPHGIPLIVHAQKGGDAARKVVELLERSHAPTG
jgi:hypothetical protein